MKYKKIVIWILIIFSFILKCFINIKFKKICSSCIPWSNIGTHHIFVAVLFMSFFCRGQRNINPFDVHLESLLALSLTFTKLLNTSHRFILIIYHRLIHYNYVIIVKSGVKKMSIRHRCLVSQKLSSVRIVPRKVENKCFVVATCEKW